MKYKILLLIIGIILISICFIFKTNVMASGLVKGIFIENIEGIEYEKIIDYAPAGIYTLKDMLKKLKIDLDPIDKIKFFPDPSFGIGSRIEIIKANEVVVNDRNYYKTYRTWSKNIKDFLQEKNIPLDDDDSILPSLEEKITNKLEITITRVSVREEKEYELIEFGTVYKDDPTLERGLTKVFFSGKNGKKELTYLTKEENGKQIYKNLVQTKVIESPEDKIIYKGTKITILGKGNATWYDWISGMTAAHNSLPMGSFVLVRNNANGKEVTVKIVDRGIQGNAIIDLSADAFKLIAPLGAGRISVTLEKP